MTSYEKLATAIHEGAHTVEIKEKSSGKCGVADLNQDKYVAVFLNADDGSDDDIISPSEFNERFEITAVLYGSQHIPSGALDYSMELIAHLYSMMDDDEKAEWSPEAAKDMVLGQHRYEIEQGIAPHEYDANDFYETITELIAQDTEEED